MGIERIVKELSRINGISNVRVLNKKEKKEILKLEDNDNIGIINALNKKHTLAFSKSKLNENELIKKKKSKFPLIKIRELEEAVSALPGFRVHKKLAKHMDLEEEDVTVLVGLEEITDAIKEASETEKVDFSKQIIFENFETKKGLRAVYSITTPELTVDYLQLFSYLNTRPTKISYDYEFETEKGEKGDVLTFEVLERLNRARRMETTLYSATNRDALIPEGFTAQQLEHFNINRKLAGGWELNQILYNDGFS